MLWPVIEGGVEAVLVGDGDPAPPVQHHGLRGLEVVQVDCLHSPPQPQLPHLEAEPPGPHLEICVASLICRQADRISFKTNHNSYVGWYDTALYLIIKDFFEVFYLNETFCNNNQQIINLPNMKCKKQQYWLCKYKPVKCRQ